MRKPFWQVLIESSFNKSNPNYPRVILTGISPGISPFRRLSSSVSLLKEPGGTEEPVHSDRAKTELKDGALEEPEEILEARGPLIFLT